MDLRNVNGTPMEFDEHIESVSILEQLRAQREAGRFCDVVFYVNQHQYVAHRNVVAACSPYFNSVFDINKAPKEHLSVICQDNNAFEKLIDYMYTGKIKIHRGNATSLMRLANHFMISKLKDYCCEYLQGNITVGTCFSIKDSADKCECPSLSQNTHYFVLCNISEVIRQNEILEFTFAKLEQVLSNRLYTLRQEEKFQLILRWTKFNLKEREHFFKTLLSFVNWSSFSLDEIYNSLKHNDIYVKGNTCLFHLLQVLADNGVDLRSHIDVLQHLRAKIETMHHDAPYQHEESTQPPSKKAHVEENVKSQDEISTPEIDMNFSDDRTPEESIYDLSTDLHPLTQTDLQLESDAYDMRIPYSEGGDGEPIESSDVEEAPEVRNGYVPQSLDGDKNHKVSPSKATTTTTTTTHPSGTNQKKVEYMETVKSRRQGKPRKRFPFEQYEDDGDSSLGLGVEPVTRMAGDEELGRAKVPQEVENVNKRKPVTQGRRGRRRKERMKCPKCDFFTCNENKLSSHIRCAHKTEDVYKCSLCDFSCRWNREYYKHVKCHFSGPPFVCDYEECTYTVDRIQSLLQHRMRHSGERPWHCTVCNQRFRTKNNLKTHFKSHSGEKPYKCEVCDRSFATKGTLEQHSVTHSTHRPYLCELCGFSTKYQSHLILHKRVHRGEVFRCQHPKCNYSTPKRSQLACHMRTHLQLKGHTCNTCGRGFTERSHLVRHERIHLQEKPFKCDLCEYSSTRRDKLKDHTRRYHEEKSPEKAVCPPPSPAFGQPQAATGEDPPEPGGPGQALEQASGPGGQGPGQPELQELMAANMASLPPDAIISASAHVDPGLDLGDDGRDMMMQSSVVTTMATVSSPTTMAMLMAGGLDARNLSLLLPAVVAMDTVAVDAEHDHFRSSLLAEQTHQMGVSPEDEDSHQGDAFLGQGAPAAQLQQLQNHAIHLQQSPVTDFQASVSSHPGGRTSPDIPGISSLMNMF